MAADDLEEIWTYIARSSITYASNVIQRILDSVEPPASYHRRRVHGARRLSSALRGRPI